MVRTSVTTKCYTRGEVSLRKSVCSSMKTIWVDRIYHLSCETERSNESGLCEAVFSGNPPRPALPNHVYRFDPLQRPPRRNQRAISFSFSQPRPLLHHTMVLFRHIVEVLALT
jgi:hypothetical protein